jgi:hypothetical protein
MDAFGSTFRRRAARHRAGDRPGDRREGGPVQRVGWLAQADWDAVGYYSAAGSAFHLVNALRVMDTRTGFGGAGEAILPHAAAKLSPLWSTVLPSGANVTAGALTVFSDGVLYQDGIALPNSTSLPGTRNIAFLPGQAQSNLVIVPTSGLADFYNGSEGNLQVIADLEGYYTG